MKERKNYITKHNNELINYLEKHKGEHLTISQIFSELLGEGISISYATVYRQVEKLVNEGKVLKYTIDNTSSACFEYIDNTADAKSQIYHLKCEKCGKVIHLSCDEISEFENHIAEHHNFTVNPVKTVFYGICGSCSTK